VAGCEDQEERRKEEKRGERREERVILPPAFRNYKRRFAALVSLYIYWRRKEDVL